MSVSEKLELKICKVFLLQQPEPLVNERGQLVVSLKASPRLRPPAVLVVWKSFVSCPSLQPLAGRMSLSLLLASASRGKWKGFQGARLGNPENQENYFSRSVFFPKIRKITFSPWNPFFHQLVLSSWEESVIDQGGDCFRKVTQCSSGISLIDFTIWFQGSKIEIPFKTSVHFSEAIYPCIKSHSFLQTDCLEEENGSKIMKQQMDALQMTELCL